MQPRTFEELKTELINLINEERETPRVEQTLVLKRHHLSYNNLEIGFDEVNIRHFKFSIREFFSKKCRFVIFIDEDGNRKFLK